MKHLLFPLLAAVTLLAACDFTATSPTEEDEFAASKHMVPFMIKSVTYVAPDAVPVPCTLPDGVTPIGVDGMSHWLSNGTASHLGKIHSSIIVEECVLDPTRGVTMMGPVTHFGADGSTWTADYKLALVATSDPVVFDLDFYHVYINGGTKRFVGLRGTGLGKGNANILEGTGWYEINGMLDK